MNETLKKELRATAGAKVSERRRRPYIFSALYHLLRLGLAGIFIYAGFVKLMNPKTFAHALAQFQLIPDGFLPTVAIGLPAAELLAGLGLIFDRRTSLMIILSMLIGFILILGYAIINDLDIDCGCFTLDELTERTTVKVALFRDLFMVAALFFLFWGRRFRAQVQLGKLCKSRSNQGKDN